MNTTASARTGASGAREIVPEYLKSGHTAGQLLSDDVVFVNMATGDRQEGREAVGGMSHYFYNVAFDADAKIHRLKGLAPACQSGTI